MGTGAPLGTAVFSMGGKRLGTCLHVVEGNDQGLNVVMPRESFDDYRYTTNPEYFVQRVQIESVDPVHDLAVLRFAEPTTTVDVPYTLGSTDAVRPGDGVAILGYPHMDAGRIVLTRHDTTVGARVLIGNKGIASKHLVLNSLVRPGQSGGPVFHPKSGRLVAVVVGGHASGGGGLLIQGVDPTSVNQSARDLGGVSDGDDPMTTIAVVIEAEGDWLGILPAHQRSLIEELAVANGGLEEAAREWLDLSTFSNVAPVGAGSYGKQYFNAFLNALHDQLCSSKNEQETQKLLDSAGLGSATLAATVTASISPALSGAHCTSDCGHAASDR